MYIVIMTKEGSTHIMNFMTPGQLFLQNGFGHVSLIVKIHYFLKNLYIYSQAKASKTMYIVMVTNEGSNKIVTFMTPAVAGVLALGCGHISHIVKMHYSFKNLLFYS